ncbi:mannose-1-phosphate guanylyltransferase [Brevundimonas sp.]|uniref:mannose-1-phosphate guanylyltransferase n=1 Tax=Brevundimonas sp. TaxID=1871086 RepID=UPI002E11A05F|nr:mannose-1-phosphate guanylyltransferase [Brevundimonas sp.]
MTIVPIVLCGGGGTRLWPASTPDRPKGLMSMAGRSLLAATLERCRGLGDRAVVVASAEHEAPVRAQIDAGPDAVDLVLETAARDTAPALLAGARVAAARDPRTVVALVPCDHYVSDDAAFRDALRRAADLAQDGRLVLLGVIPAAPSSAYGHIRPARPGPAPVAAFVEKPDLPAAERLTAEGCLWNAGILVGRADVLWAEAELHAPEVTRAVAASVADPGLTGSAYAEAPRISMDYAVLEKTDRAWVLPVDFGWSDLGAWDAVADRVPSGPARLVDAERVWVQAPEGVQVAVVGLSDVVVVVQDGAVLVCARDAAQKVRRAATD